MQPDEPTEAPSAPVEDEETTTVYWVGNPEASAVSVGSVGNLDVRTGKCVVPISVAVYLTQNQPKMFSPVPPAPVAKKSTPSKSQEPLEE